MAERRFVSTLVWQDPYFRGLDDVGQLVYLHLLTTPGVTYYGTLKANPEMVAAEMGRPVDVVRAALDRLATDGRIVAVLPYWMVINYFPQHQGTRDGQAAPELPGRSRAALLSNKYEIPPAVLAAVLANWRMAPGALHTPPDTPHQPPIDSPSNTLSDTLSNTPSDTLSDIRKKGEGRRENEKGEDEGGTHGPSSSASRLRLWNGLPALDPLAVGILNAWGHTPSSLPKQWDQVRADSLSTVCEALVGDVRGFKTGDSVLNDWVPGVYARALKAWLLPRYDRATNHKSASGLGNVLSKHFADWLGPWFALEPDERDLSPYHTEPPTSNRRLWNDIIEGAVKAEAKPGQSESKVGADTGQSGGEVGADPPEAPPARRPRRRLPGPDLEPQPAVEEREPWNE